jgi:opacity protein-like surface antigen
MSNNLKKVLAVSVLALGFSSAILASGEMPVAMPAAEASNNYVFIALQGGYALQYFKNYYNSDDSFSPFVPASLVGTSDEGGFGARASLGYGFNQNFSVEVGYSYLFNKPEINVLNTEVADIKTQIVDAFFKVQAQAADNFDLYAKVGADYMMNDWENANGAIGWDGNVNEFGPAFGVGAAYNFTPNWTVDVSWTRYIGQIKINKDWQPNIDFFALGLMYKFNF